MKPFQTVTGVFALLAFAVGAQAHTHLKQSTPAEGSVVTTPPTSIVLKFSEAARPTAVTVQKDGKAAQKLEPLPTEAKAEVSIPAPKLSAGKYTVNWRVVSGDNHVMSGVLHFTVASPTASAGAPAR